MSTTRVDISEPRSSTSERPDWKKIFDGRVYKGDQMWKDYLEEADTFDGRIVERWNKIVDVILVYVTLFIAILSPFVTAPSTLFTRDSVDVSNDLLFAIYGQLVARFDNTSIPPAINTTLAHLYDLDPGPRNRAIISSALIYSALAISTVVSMVALAAKLWLAEYSRRTFDTVGSPYERAIKRQEAYNGILEWKMMAVINVLPLMLLVALIMFGFYIHLSIEAVQPAIGYAVGTVLTLGLISLLITSIAAAFIPACPFHSPFSTIIQLVLESPLALCRILSRRFSFDISRIEPSPMVIQLLLFSFFLGSGVGIGYLSSDQSSGYFVLVSIPVAIVFAFLAQKKKIKHKPQRYRLPLWSLCFFLLIGSFLSAAGYFSNSDKTRHVFIPLYAVGMLSLLIFGWMADRLSKSMKDTGEVDAIAWLLKTPSDKLDSRDLFKKAGQIASSPDGSDYKPRLLELLFPLLSSLIKDHAEPNDSRLEYLELYVSCLAELSDFKNDPGRGLALLWEDAKRYPDQKDELLHEKLMDLATNPRYDNHPNLKNAANMLVEKYEVNLKKGLRSLLQASAWGAGSITALTEPPHSYEEMSELNSRRNNGYYRVSGV